MAEESQACARVRPVSRRGEPDQAQPDNAERLISSGQSLLRLASGPAVASNEAASGGQWADCFGARTAVSRRWSSGMAVALATRPERPASGVAVPVLPLGKLDAEAAELGAVLLSSRLLGRRAFGRLLAGLGHGEVHGHAGGELLAQVPAQVLPTVRLAQGGLARRRQRPEQRGGGSGGRQHGLRPDPALELLLYPGPFRQQLIAFSMAA